MKRPTRYLLTILLAHCLMITALRAGDAEVVAQTRAAYASRAAEAERQSQTAIRGRNGWFYFVPELRALSAGPFWGDAAAKVSRAAKPEYADPLPAILDFHQQLQTAGVELLLVPVPAKAVIYPEGLAAQDDGEPDRTPPRADLDHQAFYKLLQQRGVPVLDLVPLYLQHRQEADGPLYCQTDSHWSGRGVELAATAIHAVIHDRPWLKDLPKVAPVSETRSITFAGDLARMIDEQHPAQETLPLTFVGTGGGLAPLMPSRESPVLLIGDSHTLIFHDPTLVAQGAGLPDHLALRLGTPVDLVGVRGSGATTTRIELLRRKDQLAGKKLVIWCFSFREFTESSTGWRSVPVIR